MTVKRVLLATLLLFCYCSSSGGSQLDPNVMDTGDVNVITFEEMAYPHLAYYTHLQGAVAVRIKLDEQGKVTDAVAISGLPLLAGPSVENVKRWIFKPNATKTGLVIYDFRILDGRCNRDSSLFILQGKNIATVLACPPQVNPSTAPPE